MTTNLKTKQLEILLHDFELMSKTAITQAKITEKLLQDSKLEALFEEALSNEIIMDRIDMKIREEVVFTILQFSPIARDLRKIITYQDIAMNLERVGDMLLNIIYLMRETNLHEATLVNIKKRLEKMLHYSSEMLKNAVYSFSNGDSQMAYLVIKEDDKVNNLQNEIEAILTQIYKDKKIEENDIQIVLNINTIAHNLERIGDSATNIAEATIYLTEGRDIRHEHV